MRVILGGGRGRLGRLFEAWRLTVLVVSPATLFEVGHFFKYNK